MIIGIYVDESLEVLDIRILQTIKYLNKPFEIHVFISNSYDDDGSVNIDSDEELYDDGAVFEELPPCVESFKTDYCVVCLSEEPHRLFLPCLHYCVCPGCDEAKPFRYCPCCKREITA